MANTENDDDIIPGPLDEENVEAGRQNIDESRSVPESSDPEQEHRKQREREKRGNRGPDEVPGFGEGV
jgi:hypothetical protein